MRSSRRSQTTHAEDPRVLHTAPAGGIASFRRKRTAGGNTAPCRTTERFMPLRSKYVLYLNTTGGITQSVAFSMGDCPAAQVTRRLGQIDQVYNRRLKATSCRNATFPKNADKSLRSLFPPLIPAKLKREMAATAARQFALMSITAGTIY